MPDGVKTLLDVILQTNDFFRKYFCFRQRETNACFFQLIFWTRWKIHIKFHVE